MKFLFLCTGNSCRSILSEVLFNSRALKDWKAYSAGSKPSGQVHPLTIETLENLGLSDMSGYSAYLNNVYFSGSIFQVKPPKMINGT